MRSLMPLFLSAITASLAFPQWQIQQSNTTASLRGIDNVGHGVAWASGTEGTVLHTTDGGKSWRRCSMPPGAAKLDFRGIEALDGNTAVVMSSGPGDQSRIYKTTDGCQTWKLVFANPDSPNGFFDALQFQRKDGGGKSRSGLVIGDPIANRFAIFATQDAGEHWVRAESVAAQDGDALFAASNSSLLFAFGKTLFVTGGPVSHSYQLPNSASGDLPLQHGTSAGAFSVAGRSTSRAEHNVLIAVGGDYQKPDQTNGTCARSVDGGLHWIACDTPTHGYRSAVEYEDQSKTWIAVGPNGTDVSKDDGRIWRRLSSTSAEASSSDRNWNALSLPFVVGSTGRIGKYQP